MQCTKPSEVVKQTAELLAEVGHTHTGNRSESVYWMFIMLFLQSDPEWLGILAVIIFMQTHYTKAFWYRATTK